MICDHDNPTPPAPHTSSNTSITSTPPGPAVHDSPAEHDHPPRPKLREAPASRAFARDRGTGG